MNFQEQRYIKLHLMEPEVFKDLLEPLYIDEEYAIGTFQGIRDGVVFTNHRIISIDIQGMTGKKKRITSLPYHKILLFSIETAGVMDPDSELHIWVQDLGQINFEFTSSVDLYEISQVISTYFLERS